MGVGSGAGLGLSEHNPLQTRQASSSKQLGHFHRFVPLANSFATLRVKAAGAEAGRSEPTPAFLQARHLPGAGIHGARCLGQCGTSEHKFDHCHRAVVALLSALPSRPLQGEDGSLLGAWSSRVPGKASHPAPVQSSAWLLTKSPTNKA